MTRNWDYRYCWLRDAGFTVRALLRVGNPQEAHAFAEWLLHATRLTHPELQVMYTLFGEANIPERTLDGLEGYRGSRPVRVGNAAASQFQLDVYGEVADALVLYFRSGGSFDREAASHDSRPGRCDRTALARTRLRHLGSALRHAQKTSLQDHGLGRPAALHRAVAMPPQVAPHLQHTRPCAIRSSTGCSSTASTERSAISWHTPGHDLDAALLVIPLVGFLPAQDPRVAATVEAIRATLTVDELVYRYTNAGWTAAAARARS